MPEVRLSTLTSVSAFSTEPPPDALTQFNVWSTPPEPLLTPDSVAVLAACREKSLSVPLYSNL